MLKVKTFTSALKIFHAKEELDQLDAQVNKFIKEERVKNIVSVNDAVTASDKGETIGIIRVVAYETPE